MTSLSITTAWNETIALVGREARLLFPVALALVALPSVLLQFFTPSMTTDREPELGAWMLLWPVVLVLGIVGTLTISLLALRPGTVVRDAIAQSARRFPPLFGAALLVGAGALLVVAPLVLLIRAQGEEAPGVPWYALVAVLMFVLLGVRLQMMNPVAVVERGGVIDIIRRSWQLTRGHFWKLLAFLLLFVVLFIVVGVAVTSVGGLIVMAVAGTPQPGSPSTLFLLVLGGIVESVLIVFFTVMISRIYAQLAVEPRQAG